MLGLCAADHTMAPRWQVYQNYWNMLAAGYKSLSFFSWWDFDKILPIATKDDMRRRKEAMEALEDCGKHKDWIMPAAKHWQDPPAASHCSPLWVLITASPELEASRVAASRARERSPEAAASSRLS